MKLGSVAVSSSQTFKLTYLPQFLVLSGNYTSNPDLKVTVQGDGVICDLDAKGVAALDAIRGVRNESTIIQIALADGIITGKNVEVLITNNDTAASITVYEYSTKKGVSYIRSMRSTVFANTQSTFQDFAFLAAPDLASNDVINVTYVDGHNQQLTRAGLKAMTALMQAVDTYSLDNLDGLIDTVQIIPTADVTVYRVDFQPPGNLS